MRSQFTAEFRRCHFAVSVTVVGLQRSGRLFVTHIYTISLQEESELYAFLPPLQ